MRKTNLKFGCEFEFSSSWEEVREAAKISISRHYKKNLLFAKKDWFDSVHNTRWHLKTDSSTECELCTPVSSYGDIKRICAVVADLGKSKIKITANDSFHLHVDTGGVDPRKIVAAWMGIEKGIIKCFPRHRRHKYKSDSFCDQLIPHPNKSNVAKIFMQCYEYSVVNHHAVMSLFHYEERKTAELRIAEGTTDPDLVNNWIHFGLQFIKYAERIDPFDFLCRVPADMGVDEIIETVGIGRRHLREWVRDRYKKFRKK